MTAEITELLDSLSTDSIDPLGQQLDALADADRLAAVRGMGRKVQAKLYAACEARGVGAPLSFLVPDDLPEGKTVIFDGKNSLPLFSWFQKRFTRDAGGSGLLMGYNHQSMSWLTGPGYFKTRIDRDTVLFDYTLLPETAPEAWPAILPNDRGFSHLVYKNMYDYCYPVGAHTLIGAAYDGPSGKSKGQTFLLTRGETI